MYESFLWGVGFSCGLAVGFLLVIGISIALDTLSGRQAYRREMDQLNARTIRALERRNELTEETVLYMAAIADAARVYATSK